MTVDARREPLLRLGITKRAAAIRRYPWPNPGDLDRWNLFGDGHQQRGLTSQVLPASTADHGDPAGTLA